MALVAVVEEEEALIDALDFKPSKPAKEVSTRRLPSRFQILYVSEGVILPTKGITELLKWKEISM